MRRKEHKLVESKIWEENSTFGQLLRNINLIGRLG